MRDYKTQLLRSVAAACLLALPLWADPAQSMTLKEAVEIAINTNPEVGSVSNNRRAIDEELRQGRALYLPQIDLRAATGPEYSDNVTVEARGKDDITLVRKEGSATLSQLLFDGFFADSEVEKQIARVESAAHRVNETSEFIGLDAVEAYLEVLRHRARVEIAENNVQVHRQRLDQVRARADAGGGNIADVRQAEARLSNAESSLNQVRGDLARRRGSVHSSRRPGARYARGSHRTCGLNTCRMWNRPLPWRSRTARPSVSPAPT